MGRAGHAAVDAPAADVAAGLWSGPDVEHHAELRTTELCAKGPNLAKRAESHARL